MVKELPFEERTLTADSDNFVVRVFKESTNSEELKWHWDEEDRVIHPIHRINIPKGAWHRLIKGTGDLSIIVEKKSDI